MSRSAAALARRILLAVAVADLLVAAGTLAAGLLLDEPVLAAVGGVLTASALVLAVYWQLAALAAHLPAHEDDAARPASECRP